MLDQQDRVPGFHEFVQRFQQPLDAGQVQSRDRLIQNVESVLGALQLAQFSGDFDALRFAPRQRRRGLS